MAFSSCNGKRIMSKHPNIIFILSDQHSAKLLGCNNHPEVKTPNLDAMACGGVRFNNAIPQNPICTPSRVSWLSGQYCHNHGYYGLDGPHPFQLPTIFGHFRRQGYKTAAIGKIHCPAHWVENDTDVFHEAATCSVDGRSPDYTAYLEERGIADLEDHAALREFGDRGRQSLDARPSEIRYEDSPEGWSVRKSIGFMQDCIDKGKPFLAHVSMARPHQCYTPARQFWDRYDESKLTLPPNADWDLEGKAPTLRGMVAKFKEMEYLFDPPTYKAARLRKLHGYLGNVSHVDHAVGEILDWLKSSGADEDTIVIYSSDHGEYVCEHGIMEKAPGICTDTVTRIPMVWRWNGHLEAGHVAQEVVEAVDMAPTLCSLAGIPHLETADGRDISHLLRGKSGEVHKIGVTEFAWSKSVRKGNYRLVYYPPEMFPDDYPDGFGELYDIKSDPWEMKNLFFDPEYQSVVREMQSDLLQWLITTTRPRTIFPAKSGHHQYETKEYSNYLDRDGKISAFNVKKQTFGTYM
ncbi:MAG: sulfatase-like hydrolase/transferase [Chitinivibrionales bacterium]|nr:sulfatase-like hydrolase/transferase [Chitinivibrionales bacterium]